MGHGLATRPEAVNPGFLILAVFLLAAYGNVSRCKFFQTGWSPKQAHLGQFAVVTSRFAPTAASRGVFMNMGWNMLKTFPWPSLLKSPGPFPCPHFDLKTT